MRWPTSWTTWRLSQSRGGLARRYSLQLVRVFDSLEVYIPSPSECLAPGRASPGERGRRPQTIRLSGPRQSFTFIRSMSCTIERHPQTLRGSGPRQSFKFSRSMPWTTWRSTSTNSERLAPDRAWSSDSPCLLHLGDTHRPSEGLAPDRASSSDGPCLGQRGGLHPQTLRAFGPWQRASRHLPHLPHDLGLISGD